MVCYGYRSCALSLVEGWSNDEFGNLSPAIKPMLKNNLLKGSISSPHSCENPQADELGEYFLNTLYFVFRCDSSSRFGVWEPLLSGFE